MILFNAISLYSAVYISWYGVSTMMYYMSLLYLNLKELLPYFPHYSGERYRAIMALLFLFWRNCKTIDSDQNNWFKLKWTTGESETTVSRPTYLNDSCHYGSKYEKVASLNIQYILISHPMWRGQLMHRLTAQMYKERRDYFRSFGDLTMYM